MHTTQCKKYTNTFFTYIMSNIHAGGYSESPATAKLHFMSTMVICLFKSNFKYYQMNYFN